jgi:hypothetical protein
MDFLIGPSVLLQLISADNNPSKTWFAKQETRRLRIDAVSEGLARHRINLVPDVWLRDNMLARLDTLIKTIEGDGVPVIAFGPEHAAIWARLLTQHDILAANIEAITVQIYAIAVVESLTLVELTKRVPQGLKSAGVVFHTL